MKSTPFNPDTDRAPIPFSDDLYRAAERMKTAGIQWTPHVGCFVRDPGEIIQAPSPFPGRVYFILNLNHFLKRFDTVDRMVETLVWLPTWFQAVQLARELGIDDAAIRTAGPEQVREDAGNLSASAFIYLYDRITDALKTAG